MIEPAAEISDITHSYDSRKALDQVSFQIPASGLLGLLGPNGSGKTTLFRIISTLLHPDQGRCRVRGLDTVQEAPAVRTMLGVVFQQPALDEDITVFQNLTFHGALYGLKGQSLRERINDLAHCLDLQDRLQDRVSTLSGGLKRRADLIRGLLHKPALLLLDEPTTGLDPAARHTFWTLLSSLRSEEPLTLVLATHLLEEAEACDHVVILDQGKVAVQGNPEHLRRQLGEDMLWLTSPDTTGLARHVFEVFGYSSQIVDKALCISDPAAIQELPSLYQELGRYIESATVRKPTLEDVFLTSTGKQPGSHERSEHTAYSPIH